jgi:hypothetical protein
MRLFCRLEEGVEMFNSTICRENFMLTRKFLEPIPIYSVMTHAPIGLGSFSTSLRTRPLDEGTAKGS